MKRLFLLASALLLVGCAGKAQKVDLATEYHDIIDISTTPEKINACTGLYTEQGAWIGFATPAHKSATGFVGPFDIDNRKWLSEEIVGVDGFVQDSTTYLPGRIILWGKGKDGAEITQTLRFVDKNNALLTLHSDRSIDWNLSGDIWFAEGYSAKFTGDGYNLSLPRGEQLRLSLQGFTLEQTSDSTYSAKGAKASKDAYAYISFFNTQSEIAPVLTEDPSVLIDNHTERWNGYITSVLRDDMPHKYDRVAVKSMITLLSNWRSAKGDIFHDGIIPSHGIWYFVGFWAWDTWKQAVATAMFDKELAKNQIRSMFDYQLDDGMVIDCIYSDAKENNTRDSKPPLAAWAVDAIGDKEFTREMYPKLEKYYNWWYKSRDNNQNGIPEFGSTDGTLVAAAWESGMDNAVRYDDTEMVKNHEGAWSMNQESVDLASYLVYEYELLQKMANELGVECKATPIDGARVAEYFYDAEDGFFYDKLLKGGEFVRAQGSEAYTPLWTKIATQEQADAMYKVLSDTAKFSTYIPMPTLSAAHPKFMPKGYWRGPIWLDQTYFGISGLRNYGYTEEADAYTYQVFDRLYNLTGNAPIYENYGTHTGEPLKAPHFSWSAAHLLMLYHELSHQSQQ